MKYYFSMAANKRKLEQFSMIEGHEVIRMKYEQLSFFPIEEIKPQSDDSIEDEKKNYRREH